MNSNLKLLPATLLVAVLALAGCGGGSGDDTTTPPPPPPPTPQEECENAGNNWHEGACYTDQELIDLGIEQGEQNAADKAAAEARLALAKALREILSLDAVAATTAAPVAGTSSADVVTALGTATDADNGEGAENAARVLVLNNRGPMVKVSALPNGESLTDVSTLSTRFISGSGFATGTSELKEHADGSTVRGHYRGASGGYVCTSGCTSQLMANGGIMLGGTWASFDVDAGQMYDALDASYATYGAWRDAGIVDTSANAGAWYVVSEPTAITEAQITAASGEATYSGEAVGQAAYYHSLGGDANVGGTFTADAELKANFDTNMLSGSITDFDVGGVNPGWSVELMRHAIAATGVAVDTATAQTKWTVDGTAGAAGGNWSAQFYEVPDDQHQPKGVAGGFEATYESDGFMVGAFGAER